MTEKNVPFTRDQIETLGAPTPYHVYDEAQIRANARRFYKAFDWVPGGFKNYFAVKALPNPYIMEVLKEEGMGADCSSEAELVLSEAVGITGEDIMFTSNDTPAKEYIKAKELGAIINLDDITHLEFLKKEAGLPDLICFRYNPGALKGGNAIIGHPEDAKYGFTREQIFEGYKWAKENGIKRFGLHTMVASNELTSDYFIETANLLFDLVAEVHKELGIEFDFVNLGGGIGIPYKPEDTAVDLEYVGEGIRKAYESKIAASGIKPFKVVMESGRMVTGPYGYLVTKVLHEKHTYKDYVGVDACMANLMRPGMYGAYHHITVLNDATEEKTFDVSGSLCENNDKFAIDRKIPVPQIGDYLVIHDTGAHGHAMGFNYNGKLRSAEYLMQEDGSFKMIRRAETLQDLFSTLDYKGL